MIDPDLWLHVRCCPSPYRVEYLRKALARAKGMGFTGVFIEYEANFPYVMHPRLSDAVAYPKEEIAEIERTVVSLGLKLCVKGHSFSHCKRICQIEQYISLSEKGGDSVDLTKPESARLMCDLGEEILALHPSCNLLHFGGDEIQFLGKGGRSSTVARQDGRSAIYIRFVNQLARHFARHNKRIAIWSDMLIRYPEAVEQLDRSVVVFYWDYWSYENRVPFVTIGGGCPDLFVLDRAALRGDLEKILRDPTVRPKSEIPIGHMDYFKDYWQMEADRRSAASFPYLKWFRDLGVDVVAAMLSYPEKGSFLPRYGEKIEHVRGWVSRGNEYRVTGYLSCLWQNAWPCLEASWPGQAMVAALTTSTLPDTGEVYDAVAKKMACGWSSATTGQFLYASEHFEFGDILDPFWGGTPISQRLAWLQEAGWLEDDTERAQRSIGALKRLREQLDLARETFADFAVRDLLWRAESQLALTHGSSTHALCYEGAHLRAEFGSNISSVFKRSAAKAEEEARYAPWLEALGV